MLPSTFSRGALLACPPFPPWNLPSFTVESTLSTPCSRSDPPLSRQGVALAHLDSLPPHNLVLWTDGSVPFRFGKGGSGVLANCSLCGTEATLSFSAGPVCSSLSAEACAILHALCWSRQHHKVCRFSSLLLSDSRSVLYLKLCGRSGRNCLFSPSVLLDYNGSPDTRFSQGTTQLMSWPDGVRYLRPPQSLVVSLLSRTGGVLSHRSSLTHRFPRFPPRNLLPRHCCYGHSLLTEELALPRHARCVLSRLRCNGHSLLLGSYLTRIGRTENPSCSACEHSFQDTSDLILHCPATDSLRRSLFGDLCSRPWGVARLLGTHGLPPCAHPSEGVGKQQLVAIACTRGLPIVGAVQNFVIIF